MSSCGSSGYFSSSPTLSSSPPVLCNPKSGEWPKGGPISVTVRDGQMGGLGSWEADSQMEGVLVCGSLITACSWGQHLLNGREGCRFGQRENWAAMQSQ